jgi:hypothetical protein
MSRLDKGTQEKRRNPKSSSHQLTLLGVPQNTKQTAIILYTTDLVQTHVDPMNAASVSVSPYQTYLVDLVDHILLLSSTPSDSYSLSFPSSVGFLSSKVRSSVETSNLDSSSAWYPMCFQRQSLWRWLDKAPIYEYSRISLGIIWLAFSPLACLIGLYFRSLSYPVSIPGHTERSWTLLMAWASS